jgi:ABC-type multidrug transport system ATPase subunit
LTRRIGNKREICLPTVLPGTSPIVVLDEAASGFEFSSRTRMWSLISALRETAVIVVTHALEEYETIANRIVVLVE